MNKELLHQTERTMHEASREAAVDTLLELGYTYYGALSWKPPIVQPEQIAVQGEPVAYVVAIPDKPITMTVPVAKLDLLAASHNTPLYLRAAIAQPEQTTKPATIEIDFKQATELLEMFGGEPSEITLLNGDEHSGKGLYAYYSDYPEEGAEYLGVSDEETMPAPVAQPEGDAKDALINALRNADSQIGDPNLLNIMFRLVNEAADMLTAIEKDEWKEAALDAFTATCMDAPQDETPRSIIQRLIARHIEIVLDPSVSDQAPAQGAKDAEMLDWYEAHADQIFNLGKTWYWCKSYGSPHYKASSVREAIDAAIASQKAKS